MAIISRHHGDSAIGTSERRTREEKQGVKGGDPLSLPDTVSVKHKGDSWRWGGSGGEIRGRGEKRARQRKSPRLLPLFAALSACLLAPFLCHLTLLSSPLLAVSDLSLSSSSFVALPPPHSTFTPFCLAAIYLDMITPSTSPPSLCPDATFPPSSI